MSNHRRIIFGLFSTLVLLLGIAPQAQADDSSKTTVFCGWFAKSAQYHAPVYVGEIHTGTYSSGVFKYSNENGTSIEMTTSSDFGVSWIKASLTYSTSNSSGTSYTSPTIPANRHYRYFADFIFQDFAQSCSAGTRAVLTGNEEVRPIQWTGSMTADLIVYGAHSPPDCSVNFPQYTLPSGTSAGTYQRNTGQAFTTSAGVTLHGFGVSVTTTESTSNSITYTLSRVAELCGSNGQFSTATGVLYSSNH